MRNCTFLFGCAALILASSAQVEYYNGSLRVLQLAFGLAGVGLVVGIVELLVWLRGK